MVYHVPCFSAWDVEGGFGRDYFFKGTILELGFLGLITIKHSLLQWSEVMTGKKRTF